MPETKYSDARALLEVAYRLWKSAHKEANATGATPEAFGRMAELAAHSDDRRRELIESVKRRQGDFPENAQTGWQPPAP